MSFYIVERNEIGISVEAVADSRSKAARVANDGAKVVDGQELADLKSRFVVTSTMDIAKQMVGNKSFEGQIANDLLKMAKALVENDG
jgi:hypothetical protein